MSPKSLPFAGSGRFSFRRRLGSGSFGVVYEAYDQKRSSRIALKVLKDASTLLQFKNEFRALADLQHPTWSSCTNSQRMATSGSSRWNWWMGSTFVITLPPGRIAAQYQQGFPYRIADI